MEENGTYRESLIWNDEDLPTGGIEDDLYQYDGRRPCLKRNVANSFQTILEACGVGGGLTYQMIKRITANSNAYAETRKVQNHFGGSIWKPIEVNEMYHFLGIFLKMSIDNRQLGGLKSYFNPPQIMRSGPSRMVKVIGFSAWAADRIPEYRFLQIRAAFHPKTSTSTVGDRCHQLRASIVSINAHAKRAFILGRHCSFDEGGIANTSRYNPVRQYNSSKPDKYRIDFFVMVNASDGKNFIYHLDVYQGKNANNAHIFEEAWEVPTTQKAVVNAVIATDINMDPHGMREIYMDNRYTAPELFVLLREKYKILACGTIRSNRKGWDSSIMNVAKSSPRGTTLEKYDLVNKILFGQWNDNKVVSYISSLGVSGKVTVSHRVGASKVDFQIEEALKRYTRDNFMGGVDNVDKDKKMGGSFTKMAIIKKWYKMGLMGILDCMVVNGKVAWNMSDDDESCKYRRFTLSNWKFRLILAEEMISFKDENSFDFMVEAELANTRKLSFLAGHTPVALQNNHLRVKCSVCQAESKIHDMLKKSVVGKRRIEKLMDVSVSSIENSWHCRKWLVGCQHADCALARNIRRNSDLLIFKRIEFANLTCFQIAHHPVTAGLWKCNRLHKLHLKDKVALDGSSGNAEAEGEYASDDSDYCLNNKTIGKQSTPRAYNICTSHFIYVNLREQFGQNAISRVKRN